MGYPCNCSGFSGARSNIPVHVNLRFPRETTFSDSVTYSVGGVPYDLTAIVATGKILLTCKADPYLPDSAAYFQLSLGSGISVTAPTTGQIIFTISPSETENMIGLSSCGYFDLIIESGDGSFRQQLLFGKIETTTAVTDFSPPQAAPL